MSEVDREDILAQRQEEMLRIKMKHQLDQMVKDQSGRKEEGATRGTKRTVFTLFVRHPAFTSDIPSPLGLIHTYFRSTRAQGCDERKITKT